MTANSIPSAVAASSRAALPTTMRAIRIHRLGGPEGLVYETLPTPTLREGDALVRVRAAGISPAEFTWRLYETADGRSRLPKIPSHEISGTVAAVSPDVRDVNIGDDVYALADFFREGGAAEYIAVAARDLALKPRTLDYSAAATVPLSGLTAWQALFDQGQLQPGQRVLIHGASGGVGSFAVQLARWKGAHVIATASPHNIEFVRSLGGDEIIDYHSTPFETAARDVDLVLDTVGGDTLERSWSVLRPKGLLITVLRPPSDDWNVNRRARGLFFIVEPNRIQLIELARLIDAGTVRPRVEAVYPLDQAVQAYERGIHDHPRGKIVLTLTNLP
ncbi:MAG TPA: NADP-dependent oxidoreductase [Tepidisphaeraceae bacterium]|jgi:NADPH:quinone reductase-like Zn-dependent oxidoreductase